MTKADKERILKALRDYTTKITKTPEKAREALIQEGILDADGQISKNYGGPTAA
jgi:hypothetical protein